MKIKNTIQSISNALLWSVSSIVALNNFCATNFVWISILSLLYFFFLHFSALRCVFMCVWIVLFYMHHTMNYSQSSVPHFCCCFFFLSIFPCDYYVLTRIYDRFLLAYRNTKAKRWENFNPLWFWILVGNIDAYLTYYVR